MAVANPAQAKPGIVELEFTRPPKSLAQEGVERLLRNKASVIGMIIILIFALLAIFASVIAPHNPLQLHSGKKFLPPSFVKSFQTNMVGESEFILGTDTLGRDLLSRVLYGARVSMIVGLIPTTIILLVGITVGMLSGFAGGTVDNLLMRFTDIIYGFPDLLFFITIMVSLRDTWLGNALNGLLLLFIALAIVNWVGVARIVRGQVLSLKEKEFIEAARCIGATNSRIMIRHLLPNVIGPVVVVAAFTIPGMIITEAILGYLGLGLKPASDPNSIFITSWGVLMLEGQTAINAQPFILLAPATCVALIVMAFTFLGDGLRDALDPRMRGTK